MMLTLWVQNGDGTRAAGQRRKCSKQWLEGFMFLEACLGFFGSFLFFTPSLYCLASQKVLLALKILPCPVLSRQKWSQNRILSDLAIVLLTNTVCSSTDQVNPSPHMGDAARGKEEG